MTLRESREFIKFIETIRLLIERYSQENKGDYDSINQWTEELSRKILSNISTSNNTISNYQEFTYWIEVFFNELKDIPKVNYPSNNNGETKIMRNKVFIIYGRNKKKREALFTLLRSVSLQPMEWEEIVSLTNNAAPYVGEVLDKGLEVAQAIVVLFTGDDLAKINPDFLLPNEDTEELTPQPRPNVILEAGMALAKAPTRTIIVQVGTIRGISDLLGRHIIYWNNDATTRQALLNRLENCGCSINRKGTDWLLVGDFGI